MQRPELEAALTARGISFEPKRWLKTLRKMLAEAQGGAAAAAARRACSHRRHPPTSNFSVFSPTQRLSAPSCRPHTPHPCSWHRWVFERAWPRPPRGRASSARRLGPTQGHAPCPKPTETRAAGTTWYLPRRKHAPHASSARKARKQRTDADMKPPMTSGRIKDLKKISDPWPNPATVTNAVQLDHGNHPDTGWFLGAN